MKTKNVVVFDIDDTLLYEYEYLMSAFKEISYKICSNIQDAETLYNKMLNIYNKKEDVFKFLTESYHNLDLKELIQLYRNHLPNYISYKNSIDLLSRLKQLNCTLGIITDGRSVTQRNKLTQTGMLYFFDDILISEEFGSEKPNNANYMYYHKYGEANYFYIGDNLGKDFLAPNALNWTTICLLDNGNNIHKQDFNLDSSFLPKYKINNLDEVLKFIN